MNNKKCKYSIKFATKIQSFIEMKLKRFLHIIRLLVRIWSIQLALLMHPW